MNSRSGEYGYLWLMRLHLLAGAVFAAAFCLLFLLPYSAIFSGPEAFNRIVLRIDAIPMIGILLALFVLVPLLFHAALGLMVLHAGRFNAIAYGSFRNWMYALQRLAGLLLIPFVAYHIATTWLAFAFSGRHLTAVRLHEIASPAWARALYVLGVVAAAFYIGNGLATAASTLGICASRRSRSAAVIAGWVITLALAVWGVRLVLAF